MEISCKFIHLIVLLLKYKSPANVIGALSTAEFHHHLQKLRRLIKMLDVVKPGMSHHRWALLFLEHRMIRYHMESAPNRFRPGQRLTSLMNALKVKSTPTLGKRSV